MPLADLGAARGDFAGEIPADPLLQQRHELCCADYRVRRHAMMRVKGAAVIHRPLADLDISEADVDPCRCLRHHVDHGAGGNIAHMRGPLEIGDIECQHNIGAVVTLLRRHAEIEQMVARKIEPRIAVPYRCAQGFGNRNHMVPAGAAGTRNIGGMNPVDEGAALGFGRRPQWRKGFLPPNPANRRPAASRARMGPMCGRARLSSDVSEIKLVFRIPPERPTPNFPPSWNVAPTDSLPVVRYDAKAGQRSLDMLRWGLIPYWAKDVKVGFANINAKAEGIESKPAFGKAFERRRCLVPVDSFFGWKKTGTGKQPYAIALADRGIMALAGLWENWRSPGRRVGSLLCDHCDHHDHAERVVRRAPQPDARGAETRRMAGMARRTASDGR